MTLWQRLHPRKSLTIRIILVNLVLILLALGSLALWMGYRLQQSIIEGAEAELEVRALIVANGLREPVQKQLAYEEDYYHREKEEEEGEEEDESEDRPLPYAPIGDRDFKDLVDSYATEMDARVTILDPNLTVRYSSDPQIPLHVSETHPEILAAIQQQDEHDIRYDQWTKEERLFAAAPILTGDGIEGLVQLSVPMDEVTKQVRAMWVVLGSATLVLVTLFILASIFLGEQITRPLHRLTMAAHRLAAGDLSVRLEMEREDEVGVLAAAFDHMAEEISHLLARERAFVANASHELRSPITAIQLRAELLHMHAADNERRERYIDEIRQEAEQLGHLVQQLLDLDQIQSTSTRAESIMDPAPCLRKVFTAMKSQGERAGLSMQAEIPSNLPAILLDASSCELVMRNLLDNAIKYTPPGGKVLLQARSLADEVEIIVQDTGIGIPTQDLPFVFDRFYRVESSRDREGSGLGLALVREVLSLHRGKVQIESQEGKGTKVIVRIPRASQQ